ncbi:MAG TPA: type II toxin-antitoxin system prevent-host-death family antitoxin [Gemmatimonadaceae bacterium]|nr:type II toxin-antitoxin system prevent-host-death family antitoxin [Gemmatimonadaceae bacterium]
MKTMGVAKFKEQCLALLDSLDADGIVVTKHGRPVAKVIPIERATADLIGSLRGKIVVHGDLTTTGVVWNARD